MITCVEKSGNYKIILLLTINVLFVSIIIVRNQSKEEITIVGVAKNWIKFFRTKNSTWRDAALLICAGAIDPYC